MGHRSKRKNPSKNGLTQRQQRIRELKHRFEQSKTEDNPEGSKRALKKSLNRKKVFN